MAKPKARYWQEKLRNLAANPERLIVIVVSVLLLGAVAYWLVILPLQIRAEKQRFINAQIELEQIAEDIQLQFGKADTVSKDEGCSRPNLKNSEGPQNCFTSVDLEYAGRSIESANNLMLTLSEQWNTEAKGISLSSIGESRFNESAGTQRFSIEIPRIEKLDCNIYIELRKEDKDNILLAAPTCNKFTEYDVY